MNQGGSGPRMGVNLEIWPINAHKPCLDFWDCLERGLTRNMVACTSWPSDLWEWPLGALGYEVHDGLYFEACMRLYRKKWKQIIWGTWDLNPGPKGLRLHALTNPTALFNWNNNNKQIIYWWIKQCLGKKNITRVILKRANHAATHNHLLHQNCRFFTCGFYPQEVS